VNSVSKPPSISVHVAINLYATQFTVDRTPWKDICAAHIRSGDVHASIQIAIIA
jgi:hypothetical protein